MASTVYMLWDRNEKRVVGPSGTSPTLYASSPIATTAIDRVNKHNGGKAASVAIDVVSVTIN